MHISLLTHTHLLQWTHFMCTLKSSHLCSLTHAPPYMQQFMSYTKLFMYPCMQTPSMYTQLFILVHYALTHASKLKHRPEEQPPTPSHSPQHTEIRTLSPCKQVPAICPPRGPCPPPILKPPSWIYSMTRLALRTVLTHPAHTHVSLRAHMHTLTTPPSLAPTQASQ